MLVLDLSKPDIFWHTMEMLLDELKTHLGNVSETEEHNQIDVQIIEVCFNFCTVYIVHIKHTCIILPNRLKYYAKLYIHGR